MTLTFVVFVTIAFIAGIVLGTLYARKWKALYNDVLATNTKLARDLAEHDRMFAAAHKATKNAESLLSNERRDNETIAKKLATAKARIAELEPLATLGAQTKAARDKQNNDRKAARAANRNAPVPITTAKARKAAR